MKGFQIWIKAMEGYYNIRGKNSNQNENTVLLSNKIYVIVNWSEMHIDKFYLLKYNKNNWRKKAKF